MVLRILTLLAGYFICTSLTPVFSQDKTPVKFGTVTPGDFDLSAFKIDPEASAVVVADVGNSSFEGNIKGWFTLVFNRKKRVKILSRNGFDAATDEILLYSQGSSEEKLLNFTAYTYNLENGQVTKTKLDEGSMFREKIGKNIIRQKFTFPGVKEGSIIELSYTISSDFLFNLQSWTFQGRYPGLWSEYEVVIPGFFRYIQLGQGYLPFHINKSATTFRKYNLMQPSDHVSGAATHVVLSGNSLNYRWVMKDIPVLKEESYTSTLRNHVSKLEFQLAQTQFPDQPVKQIMGNWETATAELMKDEEFGMPLRRENNWLYDEMPKIITKDTTNYVHARQIYAYLRDHFTCNGLNDIKINTSLKNTFSKKTGSVADINMLLVAMLRYENIKAYPVILSTKPHGFAYEMYPVMDRYNYVVAEALIDGRKYYLDATKPLGFGQLPNDCYNGFARVISENPMGVQFDSDSLREEKITSVYITNTDKGEIIGEFNSQLGNTDSEALRNRIKQSGRDAFSQKISGAFNGDLSIRALGIDSLNDLDNPVKIHYDFTMNNMKDDVVYFNPMMAEGYRENIFKAAERYYPVEMPYAMKEVYLLNMEVPKGYVVDEIPKSTKVKFNGEEGYFEYSIFKIGTERIQLRTTIQLNKANFKPEDYTPLRDFFGYVVKKHTEQIVFKKAK